ncbi:ankyrin repeat domain-containing protein [Tenacibaculum sp. M341]|uniref:ankyrin repeat domain-containing protein n=1 Tax=Tenacibaculum sp. M341 TaxID=2530339 RepID=UPI001053FA7C|nr:ankyrin repeat domain-containing protein [Tenacibaculum sp. M341]TCI85055.1 hypothetical protein EYW44_18715 [Tenacibaculum sp. M341]
MHFKNSISFILIILFFAFNSNAQKSSSLIELIQNEQFEQAKKLIIRKQNLNERDENKATPFMWAIYKNRFDIVKLLKKHGANTRLKGIIIDDDKEELYVGSPLTVATLKSDLEIVKFLVLKCGISANDKEIDSEGNEAWSALFYLAFRDDFKQIADFLIQKGAKINHKDSEQYTPLSYAFLYENHNYVKYLLSKKATSSFIQDYKGITPASFAIACKQENTAKKLLKENKSLINKNEQPLSNPLTTAIIYENENMVKWLLNNGADKKAPLKHIQTIFKEIEHLENYGAYHLLSTYVLNGKLLNEELISAENIKTIIRQTKKPAFFAMLFQNGFTITEKGTALYPKKKYYTNANINYKVRILEENNIKINLDSVTTNFIEKVIKEKKFNQKTFDHLIHQLDKSHPIFNQLMQTAIYANNISAFNAILDQKINLNPSVYENSNFLWMAYKNENIYMFNKLIEKGADIEFKFKNDETILHRIINHKRHQNCDNVFFLKTLLEKGANVNAKNADGNTPLHLSKAECYNQLLIKHHANITLQNNENEKPLEKHSFFTLREVFTYAESKENKTDLFNTSLRLFFSRDNVSERFSFTIKHLLNKGINLKDDKTVSEINNTIVSLAKSSNHFNLFNKLINLLKEHDSSYKTPNINPILIEKLAKTSKIKTRIVEAITSNNLAKFKAALNSTSYNHDTFLVCLAIAAQSESQKIVQYLLEQRVNPLKRKIIPYSTSSDADVDVLQTLVDKKNIKAIKFILSKDENTNNYVSVSYGILKNYDILCDLKDEQIIKEYLELHFKKYPRLLKNLDRSDDIYKLCYGPVKNNLLGVLQYLSEKGIKTSKSIGYRVNRRSQLNSYLIFDEKVGLINYFLKNANEKQILHLIGNDFKHIIKNNSTQLIDLFVPYIIKDRELRYNYYRHAIRYDNSYAMNAILKIHPKEETDILIEHIRHAIQLRNYNFISAYYDNGFNMSLKLYKRGPNVAGSGDSGMIEYAINEDRPDMVDFLIECGVSPLTPENNNDSPIEYALDTYDLDLLTSILNLNIDPNIMESYYQRPWAQYFLNRSFNVGFLEFWKRGANPNLQDSDGNNLLQNMIINDYDFTTTTPDILDKITDINHRNKKGETALFLACETGNLKIVEALLAKKADVNISNINNVTPLMIAAYTNNTSIVEKLLAKNADKTQKDYNNRNAYDYALLGNAKEVISLLK